MSEELKGIVYVMEATNTEGLIKIGKCQIDQFESRMYNIERHGYCNVSLKRRFAIVVNNYSRKEDLAHEVFKGCQVGKTELFALDVNLAIKLLSSFEGKQIYPQDESKEEVFEQAADVTETSLVPVGLYTYEMKSQKDKKTYNGILQITDDRKLLLKAGSRLAPLIESGSKTWIETRRKMVLVDGATTSDVVCTSVSEAANFVTGHRKNGWKAWRNSKGEYIDIYRKKVGEDAEE